MKIKLNGVTRIVIVLRNVVIKVPNFTYSWSHFLRGLIGNMSENQTWKWNSGSFEKGTSHLLCPVLWTSWGGWILIMKKARTLTREEWDENLSSIKEHILHFPGDDTLSNYGIFQNRLVKIDYADLDNTWGEDFKIS